MIRETSARIQKAGTQLVLDTGSLRRGLRLANHAHRGALSALTERIIAQNLSHK